MMTIDEARRGGDRAGAVLRSARRVSGRAVPAALTALALALVLLVPHGSRCAAGADAGGDDTLFFHRPHPRRGTGAVHRGAADLFADDGAVAGAGHPDHGHLLQPDRDRAVPAAACDRHQHAAQQPDRDRARTLSDRFHHGPGVAEDQRRRPPALPGQKNFKPAGLRKRRNSPARVHVQADPREGPGALCGHRQAETA